jgi:cytochrome c oxidase cbb3-type subunit 3/ubiquinol-cytochrome c reductase cytochrome c subunit
VIGRFTRALATAALLAVGAGCDALPGKPVPDERYVRPDAVKDFASLYGENCSGCHGADGRLGPARPLNDPLYLAFASDTDLIRATSQGVAGTTMPAFAISAGGTLTDQQIADLVREMRTRWARPQEVAGVTPPPYAAALGDAQAGAATYAASCASCHGKDGAGVAGKAKGSIVDGSYLALVSDQGLRSTVVAGRMDLGMPDFRGGAGGTPLTATQVADVVAWLAAQRSQFPGRPYPESK